MSDKNFRTPNNEGVLFAVSSITGKAEYLTSTNHVLDSAGGGSGGTGGAILDGVNATIRATVFSLASSKPVATQIVDATGTAITSFGGGTQYTNGAAVASPVGGVALGYDGANVRAMAADTSGNGIVVGNVASASTDSGNPVKVGGKYNATFPTLTDQQRGDVQVDARNNLRTTIISSNGTAGVQIAAPTTDTITATDSLKTFNLPLVYDGSNWVRQRGDVANGVDVDVTRLPALATGANTIGAISNTSFAATQATAASLNATVVGTGTFSTQVTSVVPGTAPTSLGKAEDAAHVSGDTGVMGLGVANEANVNLSGTDGDYTPIATQRDGTVHVMQKSSTGTTTSVAGSATSVQLLAANSLRKAGSIYNDSTAILYIKYGATASTTSYKVQLAAGAYFELSAGYDGRVDGIWATATGSARISEET